MGTTSTYTLSAPTITAVSGEDRQFIVTWKLNGGTSGKKYKYWYQPKGTKSSVPSKKYKAFTSKESSSASSTVHISTFEVEWQYYLTDSKGTNKWVEGGSSSGLTHTLRNETFTAPNEAVAVRARVKAVAAKDSTYNYKKSGKKGSYTWAKSSASWFKEAWSDRCSAYYFASAKPDAPNAPDVDLDDDGLSLTVKADSNDYDVTTYGFSIQAIPASGSASWQAVQNVASTSGSAAKVYSLTKSRKYIARARVATSKVTSDWSENSVAVYSQPDTPTGIAVKALTSTSAQVTWNSVDWADSYTVEFAEESTYFEQAENEVTSRGVSGTSAIITELNAGGSYYFRVNATCPDNIDGEFSSVAGPLVVGSEPAAPTTGQSTTTAVRGKEVTLYWSHNSEDGSAQTDVQLQIDGEQVESVSGTQTSYILDTSRYDDGQEITWRVRTMGAYKGTVEEGEENTDNDGWSDWSETRLITVWVQPELALSLSPITETEGDPEINCFPISVTLDPQGTSKQYPVAYSATICAAQEVAVYDEYGESKNYGINEEVWSSNFDVNDDPLVIDLEAGDVQLENGAQYYLSGSVAMSSGLSADAGPFYFWSNWITLIPEPDCDLFINSDDYTVEIRPVCLTDKQEGDYCTVMYHDTESTWATIDVLYGTQLIVDNEIVKVINQNVIYPYIPVSADSEPGYTVSDLFHVSVSYNEEAKTLELDFENSYTPIVYTITYILPDGVENNPNNPDTYTIESDTITLEMSSEIEPVYDEGTETYISEGWSCYQWLDVDNNEITEIPAGSMGDITVTAKYQQNGEAYAFIDLDCKTLVFMRAGDKVEPPKSLDTVHGYTVGDSISSGFEGNEYKDSTNQPWSSGQEGVEDVLIVDQIRPRSTAYWFYNYSLLTEIEGLEKLETKNTIYMNNMFNQACSLTGTYDFSNFDTKNVVDMSYMFSDAGQMELEGLDTFDTSTVTDMSYMFAGCYSYGLDVSSFDTSNVTNMSHMFDGTNAQTINVIGFNVDNVSDMSYMFKESVAKELDLRAFRTETSNKTKNTTGMFAYGGNSLNTIYCNDNWADGFTSSSSSDLFISCDGLVGAVTYDSSKTGVEMANPDTGYFTRKED